MTNKKGIQKGWVIVIAALLIQAIPFGVASNIQPLFISPVTQEYGFSLTGFSLLFTIGTIVSALAAPFIGKLFGKVNLKLMYIVGSVLTGTGFMAFSLCRELWQFYLVGGIVQVGVSVISSIGIPLLINSWFDGSVRGKALGIAFAGGPIGNIFLQQLATRSLVANGPSQSYFIFGIAALVVSLPIALFMLRMPKDASEIVTGNKSDNSTDKNNTTEEVSITLKEAQKMKPFWMIGLGFAFIGVFISAYSVQYANYFTTELQLDPSVVALTGSIFAFCGLIGSLVGGFLFDKLGTVKTLVISGIAFLAAGISIMFAGQNVIFAHLFSAIRGLGVFVYMMTPAVLVGQYFGKKEYAAILGMLNLMFAIGFSLGSVLFGVFAGAFGYNMTWIIMAGFVVAAFLSLIVACKGMEKINKELKAKLGKTA
ncbi:MAG: conjugated bile salt MFS transporter [Peptostreptococcaceae bacterium]